MQIDTQPGWGVIWRNIFPMLSFSKLPALIMLTFRNQTRLLGGFEGFARNSNRRHAFEILFAGRPRYAISSVAAQTKGEPCMAILFLHFLDARYR
jgi:hypothetical protein